VAARAAAVPAPGALDLLAIALLTLEPPTLLDLDDDLDLT
jgi:hypothetical protein